MGSRALSFGRALAGLAAFGLITWGALWGIAHAVPLPERLRAPASSVVTFEDGRVAHIFLAPDGRARIRASLDRIDPAYVDALVRYEDKRFFWHAGIDPLAVLRSAALNMRHGRVVSGASTLTSQLVRVVEPRPRTLRSKVTEALRALQLELCLDKREILEAYLSFAPFGGNLEGVEVASHALFGHGPGQLAPDEIATLLAIPQRPALAPGAPRAAELRAARNQILDWLAGHALLTPPGDDPNRLRAWLGELHEQPVPKALRALPRHAPHAARRLVQREPSVERTRSTLDAGMQEFAASLLGRAAPRLAALGIHNGALIVIDRRERAVRVLVGNPNFWDERHAGQIASFDVPRSPGSTLKPLIYAMAIDRGLALPERLVRDVPLSWASYQPENYDHHYSGLLPLEEALSASRNVPFVELLGRVGLERFLGTLRQSGFDALDPRPGHYGLSAAIGALEASPLELAELYTAFAGDGTTRPARLVHDAEPGAGVRLVSPGAAWLTRRALARRDRPDFPGRRRMGARRVPIHWKTGTSVGHRDAWAVGSGPRYTAVVWLGNLDYRPAYDLIGADAAGPLLFDLLEAFEDQAPARPSSPPGDLTAIEVCAVSGYLPTAACTTRKTVLAPRRSVPTARCPYHLALDIDLDTGLALTPTCRASRRYETRSYTLWPTSLRRFLERQGRRTPTPPAYAPGCTPPDTLRAPSITSPPRGLELVLLPGVPAESQELPLEAESPRTGEALSWFVDGRYLGSSTGERLWWIPEPGTHELRVVGESGRTARRVVRVRQPD